ncbi:hypothetical protein CS063_01625 [Sporanaerobium hydrogeniformans]|uniref:Uncharacterized protein n=1 Tax=Sporanaerobium hydrogeniformans TaxID=3072179 RepID=A0AC61DH95_9FIRM|nr:NPCBM/NEW2 domain-containing protein [Sporanaerobium hydrogeniformans]PHV72200.1 hypothetical protein CS063_01625 [Sporanaerobium hydrogeniformans]
MKKILGFFGVLLLGATIGASGVKITAELKTQKVSYNGNVSDQEVIAYNGSTYVPLRKFGELVNIPVNYKDGVVYLGNDGSKNISYWGQDIKDMSKRVNAIGMDFVNYAYNDKWNVVEEDNIGNKYTNYLVLEASYHMEDGNYIEFPLNSEYKEFRAKLGIPKASQDSIGERLIKIYVDDNLRYEHTLIKGDMPKDIVIDISKGNKLRIEAFHLGEYEKSSIGLFNGEFVK